jgi:uncharacterized protein (DUF1800 family)
MIAWMFSPRWVWGAALVLCLAACGGGSSTTSDSSSSSSVPGIAKVDAFRFLNQATFGATEADAQHLSSLGEVSTAYGRWIDEQLVITPSLQLAYVTAAYPNPVPTGFNISSLQTSRVDVWFQNALLGDDQLRQRVAFALSEIMVTSQVGALQNLPFAAADYHDLLVRDAFGNFRQLLEDVTLHPAMGVYLSMLGNQKANVAANIRPDENYARELMQLFTIGLVQLNLDGTAKHDTQGQTIATYDQNTVEGFARVYTGWKWACPTTNGNCTFATTRVETAPTAGFNQVKPMQFYAEQHETGAKQLLSYGGAVRSTIPAGQSGPQDLKDALDNIFNHPNVAPFVAQQLIQKLVTSNPSAAYVQRVASVFNNDGSGNRGNLAAVVRALLLDAEARNAATGSAAATAGKSKEPLLRITQFWRTYGAKAASGKYVAATNFGGGILGPSTVLGEGPLQSPSVFNFFSPFYAPPGEISAQNLVAPELQLATEYLNTTLTNFIWTQANSRTTAQTTLGTDVVFIDTREETALAGDSEALVNRVAEKLLGGADQMSATLKAQTKQQVERSAATAANTRVADAIYLIASSPEFSVQR